MTYEEFTEALEKLDGDAYMLKLKEPMRADQLQILKQSWTRLNERIGGKPKALIMVPSTVDIKPMRGSRFDFATALTLLNIGYKVERDTWTEGHIYKEGTVIVQSHNGKEWIPTQGALKALNWRIV